uniref:ABC transporter permease n=1 Tax=Nocardia abscessus TaxID=120957 RepID=UPI002458F3AE
FAGPGAAWGPVACLSAFGRLGPSAAGRPGWVVLIAVVDAVCGVALGLLASAFARTEFQAVQFMPVVVAPQIFLCGLLVPRDQLPDWLEVISNVMPLSYAVDALQQVSAHPEVTAQMWRDLAIVAGFAIVALCLGAATLRRRTA